MKSESNLRLTPAALHRLRRRVDNARDSELSRRSDEDLALLLSACDVAIGSVASGGDDLATARRRIQNFLLDEIDDIGLDLAGVALIADALDLDWSLYDRGTRLVVSHDPSTRAGPRRSCPLAWKATIKYRRNDVTVVTHRYEERGDDYITHVDTYTWTEAQHVIDTFGKLRGEPR